MHKSTLFLGLVAIALTIITGVVVWELIETKKNAREPSVEGTSILLGLPDIKPTDVHAPFTARSVLLWDSAEQVIRFEQNGFERLPIASLTKLMTAMVALDYGMPWDTITAIEPQEYGIGGQLLLHPGEEVTTRDLFHISLLGSANNATLAYVRAVGVDPKEFVQAMNRKAVAIGLEQTHFVEVTGLDKGNVSTSYEVARLAEYAFKNYPDIAVASREPQYTFIVGGSGREHTVRNTNKLISENGEDFTGSKTGYLYESAYCLVVQGVGEQANRIAVILGSPSEYEHFADIRRLIHEWEW